MGVNSLPKTVTRQRRGCDLNPGPSAPESSTLTTRLPSHFYGEGGKGKGPTSKVDGREGRQERGDGKRAEGNSPFSKVESSRIKSEWVSK